MNCNVYTYTPKSKTCVLKKKDPGALVWVKAEGVVSGFCGCADRMGCEDGDVRIADADALAPEVDLNPQVYFGNKWHPICGHYFWDNDNGAVAFCRKLGFASGYFPGGNSPGNGDELKEDAMPVGTCHHGELFQIRARRGGRVFMACFPRPRALVLTNHSWLSGPALVDEENMPFVDWKTWLS